MNNKLNQVIETIYKNISQRIIIRKRELKETREDITNSSNVQLLSNIMHNKRIKRRNPYLLNSSITQDIVTNLKFPSTYELIWGPESERNQQLLELFFIGIGFCEEKNMDLIEQCRYEYLPYCKIAAEFEHATFDKPEVEDAGESQSQANYYLYFNLKNTWTLKHKEFFSKKGTKKLDHQIKTFITMQLPDLLNNFIKDNNHYGLSTFNLISSIIQNENLTSYEEMIHGPEWYAHQPLTNSEKPVADIRNEVTDAGKKYIDSLVNEQIEMDDFFESKFSYY